MYAHHGYKTCHNVLKSLVAIVQRHGKKDKRFLIYLIKLTVVGMVKKRREI